MLSGLFESKKKKIARLEADLAEARKEIGVYESYIKNLKEAKAQYEAYISGLSAELLTLEDIVPGSILVHTTQDGTLQKRIIVKNGDDLWASFRAKDDNKALHLTDSGWVSQEDLFKYCTDAFYFKSKHFWKSL